MKRLLGILVAGAVVLVALAVNAGDVKELRSTVDGVQAELLELRGGRDQKLEDVLTQMDDLSADLDDLGAAEARTDRELVDLADVSAQLDDLEERLAGLEDELRRLGAELGAPGRAAEELATDLDDLRACLNAGPTVLNGVDRYRC